MRVTLFLIVVILLGFVGAPATMERYEETYDTHTNILMQLMPQLRPAAAVVLAPPSKAIRSLASRMQFEPWRVNYELLKTEIKWSTYDMYRYLFGALHPMQILHQNTSLLKQYQRRVHAIAQQLQRHHAGLVSARAHDVLGPAAVLNGHNDVVAYEAMLNSMHVLLTEAVALHRTFE